MNQDHIRNFCIIAHIDHGKSTLADRLLELTGTIDAREMQDQFLDSLSLEREKGITIKLKAVRMNYSAASGQDYVLNLIDTPGHVDFSYEVSRSLAACEGALVVVDATQGIQAQTLAHVTRAKEAGLTLIPIINKIDLPNARVEAVRRELVAAFGFSPQEVLLVSAKTGEGAGKILEEIVLRVPSPQGNLEDDFRALVFDSFYDEHLGVVALTKVFDGQMNLASGEKWEFYQSGASFEPKEIGYFVPGRFPQTALAAGEVGYVATGLKEAIKVKVGDTLIRSGSSAQPLPGYKEPKPVVFSGLYPVENADYLKMRQALDKYHLADSSFTYQPEFSAALGNGFRCGFLGLLHGDVVQERLEEEFDLDLLATSPNVVYEVVLSKGKTFIMNSAADYPDPSQIKEVREPWARATIYAPSEYIGGIMKLCEERRAKYQEMSYLGSSSTAKLVYDIPLSEMIVDFFDELKSVSSGYASLDYEHLGFRPAGVVKLDILIHGEAVSPLAQLVVKEKAERVGRVLVGKLKEIIPPQQFPVALQAAIGGKIVARETISALRKDVTAKLYGGHRDRKDKLLEQQKKGKKRMKLIGKVPIPQEAFRAVLQSK